jgi:hypothetical protein
MKFNGKYTRPTRAEVEQRLHEIGEQLKETSPGEEYFDLLREQSKLSLELDDYAFDFHEPDLEKAEVSFQRSHDQRAKLTPEQLIAEIDKLIDKNPSQSELDALLPYIAEMAGRHTLDVRRLYDSRLAELEDSDSREDLKRDLDDLLAIGGVSLDLHEYLPKPLAEPLTRLAERMAIRPEVFLLSLLSGISCLHKVGTTLTISFEDKFIVPPNLFAGVVAESGQKKSPVLRTLVKTPLDKLEDDANADLQLQHEQELAEYRSLTKDEQREKFPNGEPTLQHIDYYFNDGNVEGINRNFAKFPDRGVLYLRDELSGVFAFDKYRNGKGSERQDFLSFYDGFGKKELRAEGFVSRVKTCLLSIFGTIQPETLRKLMKDPDDSDGQWARFLFVIQPLQASRLQKSSSYDINSELIDPLYRRIDQLPKMTYHFEPAGQEFYERQYDRLEQLRVTHPEAAMRAVYSKSEGTIGRLAINLHVIHSLLGQESAAISQAIPKARVIEACKLVKFFISQVKLIHATARASEGELAPNLAAIVERSRKVGTVTARDVKMSVWAFRGASVQEVRSTFRQLESMGYGDCMGEGLHLKFAAKQKNVDVASDQKPNQTINVENRDHSQSDSNVAYNINVERFNQGDSTAAE